jgi:RimJ/RimL family protein N-acetyltransferase
VSVQSAPDYIQGKRVVLRYWQSRDDSAQRAWPRYTDPLNSLWNIPRSTSFYNGVFFSANALAFPRRVWAVEYEGTLIGRLSLRDIDQRKWSARLGISLSAAYVGHGLGTETLALFLDLFFGPLSFQTMVLDVAAFNHRAVRCYQRLGFTLVSDEWRKSSYDSGLRVLDEPANASLRPHFRRERFGTWVQFYEMELTSETWQAQGPAAQPYRADL